MNKDQIGELMRNWLLFFALAIVITGVSCKEKAHTPVTDQGTQSSGESVDNVQNKEPASASTAFAQKLPSFSLKDLGGKTFTDKSLTKKGLVLVVTAPILKNKGAQEGWDNYLSKARSGSKAKWVYLEDLQPSSFKGAAMKGMKKDFKSGNEPILLVDKEGKLRRTLGVDEKKTVVLVYDHNGKLVHSETGKPSAKAAEAIWKKVKS